MMSNDSWTVTPVMNEEDHKIEFQVNDEYGQPCGWYATRAAAQVALEREMAHWTRRIAARVDAIDYEESIDEVYDLLVDLETRDFADR